MRKRPYFSMRTGRNTDGIRCNLFMFQRLLRELYLSFSQRGYFQQAFGYYCVDLGDMPGTLGHDIGASYSSRSGNRTSGHWRIGSPATLSMIAST